MSYFIATTAQVFNHIYVSFKHVFNQKGMKLGISMPIKYKSTQKEIVLAKLNQCYGSKIVVHLLQDNEITESSPEALEDAKTWELSGAPPPGSHQEP